MNQDVQYTVINGSKGKMVIETKGCRESVEIKDMTMSFWDLICRWLPNHSKASQPCKNLVETSETPKVVSMRIVEGGTVDREPLDSYIWY